MKKVNIDIAERYEFDLRRQLRSAERLSDWAILRGLDSVNTPASSVSAWLSRVTRADQRVPARFARRDFVRLLDIASANAWTALAFPALHAPCIGVTIASGSGIFA